MATVSTLPRGSRISASRAVSALSGSAYEQVRSKTDFVFDDLGEKSLKNIDRPVRLYAVRPAGQGVAATPPSEIKKPLQLPDKPSIAVLPFQNMSGDPEQEYFADGITEEIITALSHLRTFPVTARNSSFTYKGQAVRPQRLAEELGVSYVLEGSVRKAAGRVRVTAQLIDARSGLHLWAERYDRSLDDVFGIQDEITLRIALALQPELAEAELRKGQLKRTDNLNAWDHYLRGISLLAQHTCSGNSEARAHFQQSIDFDATYGDAWAGVGWSHLRDYDLKCKDNLNESLELGFKAAQQGVKLAERSALTHFVLSTVYMWREQISLSLSELDRTLQLNPYFARAHLARGNRLDLAGRSIEGIAALRQALELNPRDPERHTYLSFLSRALLVHGSSEEALQFIEHAVVIASENPDMLYRLAVCLAKLDRVEEARDALSRCEAMRPGFLELRRSWRLYNDDERNAQFFAGMDRHGLRISS